MDSVGLILTLYNDMPEAKLAYGTLFPSCRVVKPSLIVVDAGSTDGGRAYFCTKMLELPHSHIHLSAALNAGIFYYLSLVTKPTYIGWIHPDMEFTQVGWLDILISCLKLHPEVGKIGPEVRDTGKPDWRRENQCPWLTPTHILQEVLSKDGYIFDEQFKYCGGYEDWDLNRRLLGMGYQTIVTNQARVKHEGMVSRKKPRVDQPDYHKADRLNAAYYAKKWGDNIEIL